MRVVGEKKFEIRSTKFEGEERSPNGCLIPGHSTNHSALILCTDS